MNSAFAAVIDGEIEDIQNSPSIAILADESVDIAVYKKLDIYISDLSRTMSLALDL